MGDTYQGRTPDAIAWHHVADLDLPVLCNSWDRAMAAAAQAEYDRRRALAGDKRQGQLDLGDSNENPER